VGLGIPLSSTPRLVSEPGANIRSFLLGSTLSTGLDLRWYFREWSEVDDLLFFVGATVGVGGRYEESQCETEIEDCSKNSQHHRTE
jgi:hypothetical protein